MQTKNKSPKLSTLQDISLAKERCRYNILLQEQAISTSTRMLSSSLKTTLRNSMIQAGGLIAATLAKKIIAARIQK